MRTRSSVGTSGAGGNRAGNDESTLLGELELQEDPVRTLSGDMQDQDIAELNSLIASARSPRIIGMLRALRPTSESSSTRERTLGESLSEEASGEMSCDVAQSEVNKICDTKVPSQAHEQAPLDTAPAAAPAVEGGSRNGGSDFLPPPTLRSLSARQAMYVHNFNLAMGAKSLIGGALCPTLPDDWQSQCGSKSDTSENEKIMLGMSNTQTTLPGVAQQAGASGINTISTAFQTLLSTIPISTEQWNCICGSFSAVPPKDHHYCASGGKFDESTTDPAFTVQLGLFDSPFSSSKVLKCTGEPVCAWTITIENGICYSGNHTLDRNVLNQPGSTETSSPGSNDIDCCPQAPRCGGQMSTQSVQFDLVDWVDNAKCRQQHLILEPWYRSYVSIANSVSTDLSKCSLAEC